MTFSIRLSPEVPSEEEEHTRESILKRRREARGAASSSLRFPTDEELDEQRVLLHVGDASSGASAAAMTIPAYADVLDDGLLVIDEPTEIITQDAEVRLVCIYADAFESVDAIVGWFREREPGFARKSPVLPRYWVVGTKRLGWRELGELSRIGASYEQLPNGVNDLHAWLSAIYPSSRREYAPPSPRQPLESVAPSYEDSSSIESWERDRERIARAHGRGLQRKHELLSNAEEGEQDPE